MVETDIPRAADGLRAAAADAASVLYRVSHETRYRYAAPVEIAQHITHLRPLDLAGLQECLEHRCDIDPAPAYVGDGVDVYGNHRSFFACHGAHDMLDVRALSVVRVRAPAPPQAAASPTWEDVRDALSYRAGRAAPLQAEFAFASHFAPRFAEAAAFAAPSFGPRRRLVDAALDLMHRVHDEFTYDPASTEAHTRAPQALRLRHGVCQDYAHVMIAALRSLGLAARYVSGYLRSLPASGAQQLVGADASHAWVAVWCPANGWFELDPTNDRQPAADYVRVAGGRDFADVSPLRGVIRGGGEHTLDVAVHVDEITSR